jgi:hypothetical protein
MEKQFALTVTELLANATKILETHGYKRVNLDITENWQTSNVRLFEDDYSIVAVVVHDTWGDLSSKWADAQASLVELLSKYTTSYDPKSWEGYLILLTPSPVTKQGRLELTRIRYDVSRVRKLVATGDDIKTLDDVRQVLLPLLPLQVETIKGVGESVLDMLPKLLSTRGLAAEAVEVVISAFLEQKPIVENLHKYLSVENEDTVD